MFAAFVVTIGALASAEAPRAQALPVSVAPVIDGHLDDAAWSRAPVAGGFVERKPNLRATPADGTTFRAVYDTEALYVGVACHDTQPAAILGLTRTRDSGAMFNDDAVSLKIDAHGDRRTTYGFVLNASGARLDYRGINESSFRIEFDMVWDGAVVRTETGWNAEFRIPWQALGIDPERAPDGVGFNISRDHPRRNATYDWSVMPPPYSPISASLYGRLEGFGPLRKLVTEQGGSTASRMTLTPYMTAGFRRVEDAAGIHQTDGVFNFGADLDAELGAGVRAAATVNTDFAQVDLDDAVVNLTRFGLFLPEKRDFFLTDLEVFTFGTAERIQLLHTRRIGLVQGREVPILAGLKLVGRPGGPLRIGLLQVTTREVLDDDGTVLEPWSSHLAARGVLELGGSNIGMMLTHRQSLEDGDDHNVTLGFDGAYRGQANPLLLEAFGLLTMTGSGARAPRTATGGKTTTLGDAGPAPGVGLRFLWRDELVRPELTYRWLHGDVRTDLGFARRVDVHEVAGSVVVEPRIGRGGLEKVTVTTSGQVVGDGDASDLLDWSAGATVAVIWEAGYSVSVGATWRSELVTSGFDVGRDTHIEAGRYDGARVTLSASTPSVRAVYASVNGSWEQYFGGELGRVSASLVVKPSNLLRLEVGGEYARAVFDDDRPDFHVGIVNGRVTLAFTPDIGLSAFAGWNHLAELVRLQSRFRWGFLPGSDLFVVYQLDLDVARDPVGLPFQSLLLKWAVRW